MLKVSLNDAIVELPSAQSLQQALESWGYIDSSDDKPKCAVAINGEFVPRSCYTDVTLSEGDEIDVVSAVGGG